MGRPAGRKYANYLSLRIDDDIRELLESFAQAEDRSLGQMARIILREGLAARKVKQAEPPHSMRGKSKSR